ncbi:MAG: T9SS type A sorting domain-containing protein [Flavobacteriales bacterium]
MRHIVFSILLLSHLGLTAQTDSLWTRCFGGSADEPAGFGSGFPGAPHVSAVADANANLYVCTYSASNDGFLTSNAGSDDVWVFKLNPQGDTLWTRVIGGDDSDRAFRIVFDSDNNLLITGRTASSTGAFPSNRGLFDAFAAKINSQTGEVLWLRTYGGSLIDAFFGIIPVSDGGYLMYGETASIDGDINTSSHAGSSEAWVVKTNAAGAIQWQGITSGVVNNDDWIETFFNAVELPNNQGFWLMGVSGNFNDFNTDDILLCRYSATGEQTLKKVTGSPTQDAPGGLALIGNRIYVSSRVGATGLDVTQYNGGMADCWLAAFDFNGAKVWDRSYGGTDLEYPYDLSVDGLGNLWISAVTRSTNGTAVAEAFGGFDAWYLKINAVNGDTLNTIRKGGSNADFGHATAFTPNNAFLYTVGRTRSVNGWAHSNNGPDGTADVIVSKWEYQDVTNVANVATNAVDVLWYPNPASNQLFIESANEAIRQVRIFDLSGKVMKQEVISAQGIYQIAIPELASGIYLIEVQTSQGVKRGKFVKA